MAIEIVNFPTKKFGSFHGYVCLPEGKWLVIGYHPLPKNTTTLMLPKATGWCGCCRQRDVSGACHASRGIYVPHLKKLGEWLIDGQMLNHTLKILSAIDQGSARYWTTELVARDFVCIQQLIEPYFALNNGCCLGGSTPNPWLHSWHSWCMFYTCKANTRGANSLPKLIFINYWHGKKTWNN